MIEAHTQQVTTAARQLHQMYKYLFCVLLLVSFPKKVLAWFDSFTHALPYDGGEVPANFS